MLGIFSFVKYLFKPLTSKIFFFFFLKAGSLTYVVRVLDSYYLCLADIFKSVPCLAFLIRRTKFSYFHEVQCNKFFLYGSCALCPIYVIFNWPKVTKIFLYAFSSFLVLFRIFRSINDYKLIFIFCVREGLRFNFLHMDIKVLQHVRINNSCCIILALSFLKIVLDILGPVNFHAYFRLVCQFCKTTTTKQNKQKHLWSFSTGLH